MLYWIWWQVFRGFFCHNWRPSCLKRLFFSLYQPFTLWGAMNKIINTYYKGHGSRVDFYFFKKRSRHRSLRVGSNPYFGISFYLYTYIFYPYFVWVLIVVILSFVSVNVTSVNIYIYNNKTFVWVWKIYEEKLDYWLLFIFIEPNVHLLSWVSQYVFIEKACGRSFHPKNLQYWNCNSTLQP